MVGFYSAGFSVTFIPIEETIMDNAFMQVIHIGLVAIARTTFDIELVQQGVISLSQRGQNRHPLDSHLALVGRELRMIDSTSR